MASSGCDKVGRRRGGWASYRQSSGRSPKEVAEQLGWTVEQVWDVKGTVPDAASLSKPVSGEDRSSHLEDFIVAKTLCDVSDAIIEEIKAEWLREAIERRDKQLQCEAGFLLKSGTRKTLRRAVARGCPPPKALA